MTLTVTNTPMIFSTQLSFTDLPTTIYDSTPDAFIELQATSQGLQTPHKMILRTSSSFKICKSIFPSFITFLGNKWNETAAYIALNVDLENAVVFNLYAVTEQSGGGGSDGDYRLAGTVKINSVAVQRDLVVVSDNPSGREIVGEGESAGDGTFDITYSDWDGPVFLIALDQYGNGFTASTPVNSGTVIHPTTPNGYVYVVTEAGITGATEPAWITTGSVVSGSVTFAPREYYRPVGWGPQKGALVE